MYADIKLLLKDWELDIQLLKDEKMNFAQQEFNPEVSNNDQSVDEKYIKGDVRIVTEQARYPLNTIVQMLDSGQYNLNPEFQRRHRWDDVRRSKLIESFLINVPIPPVFLYEINFSEYEVMDGLQRLTAISSFYKNEYKLEGLTEWHELNGMHYRDLPDQIRKGIDRRYLSSIILLRETAKDTSEAERLKQMVFERINSGGEKLTAQESRNALYPGDMNNLCIQVSRNEYFCKLWDIPESTQDKQHSPDQTDELKTNKYYQNMSDVELCLRFFAYRQIDSWGSHFTMECFLDEYLKEANQQYSKDILLKLEQIFVQTCELAYEVFGKTAFYLYRKSDDNIVQNSRPTKTLYDPIMGVLSSMLDDKDNLIRHKTAIQTDIKQFLIVKGDFFDGRKTNKSDFKTRYALIKDFLEKYNNDY
jgi:hypothetical protein